PLALVTRPDDPAKARAVAPVVVRGRLAVMALDLGALDPEFVESHTQAGATETGAAAYALARGLLAAQNLKGALDGKTLSGADRAALEALAEEHRAFAKKWGAALEGFEPGQAGAGGRPFLSESLALFTKTASVVVPPERASSQEEPRRRTDALVAGFLKDAVYTTEGPGRVRVDLKPAGGAAARELPGAFRLVFEEGRWRSEAHMAMAPKEVLDLVKQLRLQMGAAAD
ncbi:MAG: hypothetical protein FD126_2408, partial [Elusimicrobia bacterium]